MTRTVLGSLIVLTLASGCGDATPAPVAPSPPSPVVAAPTPAVEPSAVAAPAAASPEEAKKAEALAKLAQERAAMEASHKTDVARFTPELRAEVKALTEKAFPSTKAAVQAAAAGKHRKPGSAERDKFRHPAETLEFAGLKPTMTVVEYSPGEGWYTELLAPTLAKKGKLLVTNGDPNGPAESRRTLYAQRTKMFLDTSPEAYGKVETITVDDSAPNLGHDGAVDMVVAFRALHGLTNNKRLEPWLAAFYKALKPGGVVVVEQHRAAADGDPMATSKNGYLPEKFVIERFESAGFKLAAKSELNANPKDTKDYPEGVWTLPPSFELGDKDRAKYASIGESDRMTLKFVKVAPKADAKASPKADSKPAPKAATKP